MDEMNHFKWSEGRALKFIEDGYVSGAVHSFLKDMRQHQTLVEHPMLDTDNKAANRIMGVLIFERDKDAAIH